MSKKTYNPLTNTFDDITNRYNSGYVYWKSPEKTKPENYIEANVESMSEEQKEDFDLRSSYYGAKAFEEDRKNKELINKAQHNDSVGFLAYDYNHKLKSQEKYKELVNKYGIETLMDKFNLSEEDINHWNAPLTKPFLLENLNEKEIETLSDKYLKDSQSHYENVVKPQLQDFENKIKDGTFKNNISHFTDLPQHVKNDFVARLKERGITYDNDEDYNNVFINTAFKNIFGEEALKKVPFEERKKMVKEVSVNALLTNKFKNDPYLQRILNLDTPEKIELYNNSLFLNQKDAVEEENIGREKVDEHARFLTQHDFSGEGISDGSIYRIVSEWQGTSKSIARSKQSNLGLHALEKRDVLLEEYERKSNERKLNNAKPTIEAIKQSYLDDLQYGNTTVEEVNKEFEEAFSEMLPHYWVFKDDRELEDFTIYDKIEYLSIYKELYKKDPLATMQSLNDKMQKYIADEQAWYDHVGYGLKNAFVGTAAQLVNMANGVIGLASTMGGMDAYSDWMDSGWVNYWDKVDKYNTFSIEDQDLADMYGGVSRWKGVSAPGEEYDIFTPTTLEEIISMSKYVTSTLIATYTGVGLAGKIGNWAGAAGKSMNYLNNTAKVLSQAWASSGMAQTMAKGTYDETYNLILNEVKDRIELDIEEFKNNPIIQNQVLNEWMSSDRVNNALQETLDRASKEWEKLNRDATKEGKKLKVDKQQYLDNIRTEFLNAAFEDGKNNISSLVEERYRDEITEQHLNKNTENTAREAAGRAAAIQASISWGKEFAAGFLWNKWMVHKNARLSSTPKGAMKGLNYTASGTGVEATKKAMNVSDYFKIAAKRMGNEFGDESFDAHSEHFSQGFGLQNFNNLTGNQYNPKSYLSSMNNLYNIWSPSTGFGAGIKNVADGFFEDHVIYEGLIGAISGVGGTNVNFVNVLKRFTSKGRKAFKEEFKDKNLLYKINTFLTNGLVDDIVSEQQNIYKNKQLADVINKKIKDNGAALMSIHELLSSYSKEEEAIYNTNETDAQNAKIRVGFELGLALQDPTMRELPTIVKKQEELKRISEGNITEDDITTFLNQPENKSVKESPNSREEAAATLKQNATELLSIIDNVDKSYKAINDSKYGKLLSDNTKKQLVFNRVFDTKTDEALNMLEASIKQSEKVKYNTYTNKNAEFNSQEGLDLYKEELNEAYKELVAKKEKLQADIKKEKRSNNKHKNLIIDALELDLKAVEKEIELISDESALDYTINEDVVLSEEEILNLNPEQRGKMLDPLYLNRYNKKQQKVIEGLIQKLQLTNPKILEDIQLSRNLYTDKRLNNEAYTKILNNNEVFDNYVEYMKNTFEARAAKAALQIIKKDTKTDLDAIKDEDLLSHILQLDGSKKRYSTDMIALYRTENVKQGTQRETVLLEAEKILTLFKEIGTVADNIIPKENIKSVKRAIYNTIGILNITTADNLLSDLIKAFESVEGELAEQVREVLNKVKALHSQISTTSESKQVDREQREQENKKKVIEDNKKQDQAKNQLPEVKPEVKPEEQPTTEEKTNNTESPTIQEQAKSIGVPVHVVQTDTIDEGNIINTADVYTSIYSGYEVNPLIKEGKLIPKTGAEEKDRMSVFYRFLENRGIKLQDIIDFELARIIKKNPDTKVYFAMHSTNDSNFNNYMFAVVKYNDDVRAIHDESRGGTFTTLEGEKYLIIGAVGTDINKDTESTIYKELNHRLVKQKINYTSDHSEIDYFWVSNDYTQIKDIQAGRRVKSTKDSEVKMRSISELLYDENGNFNEESNPMHLGDPRNKRRGYSSLSWIIQKLNDYIPINTGSKRIIPLNSPVDNNGAVFLLIETADGSLLPMYINPTFYNEIKEGKLKDNINSSLMKLLSKNFEDRIKAKEDLKQFLVLSDDNTFTIGGETFNSVSIKRNGSVFKTFNIDWGVNISEFLDAIKQANFRINVTVSTLQTPGLIAEYDEAGALTTDVSVLHTRNASFTMYRIDNEGKPIIDDAPSYQPTIRPNEERQIQYGNKRYREDNGVFKDELDNIVEDKELIKKLKFSQQVEKMEPSLQEKGFNYYIIDDNKDNPIVVAIGRTNNVVIANNEQALSIIDKVNKIAEAKAKAEAAQKELEAALANAEEVDLGDLGFEESNTPSQAQTSLNVKPIIPETITPEQQISLSVIQKDVNKAGNILLENLDSSNKLLTFADIYEDIEQSIQLEDVFAEKGWKFGTQQEVEALLKSKKVPLIGITNFKSWLDLIKNCK